MFGQYGIALEGALYGSNLRDPWYGRLAGAISQKVAAVGAWRQLRMI